jgi:hypothetical protein
MQDESTPPTCAKGHGFGPLFDKPHAARTSELSAFSLYYYFKGWQYELYHWSINVNG